MASAHAPRRQRRIQEQVARADRARPKQEPKQAMQEVPSRTPVPLLSTRAKFEEPEQSPTHLPTQLAFVPA
jgi:hypothetical protein